MQKWIPTIGSILLAILIAGLVYSRSGVLKPTEPLPEGAPISAAELATRWQVEPATAARLIAGGATVLDARPQLLPKWISLGRNALPMAIAVDWRDFSDPRARQWRGRLHPDDRVLGAKLRALGIDREDAVVVAGDPVRGWGEDGRIVWMLRTLGHQRAVLVNGGYRALAQVVPRDRQPPPSPGNFTPQRSPQWTIDKESLQAALATDAMVILDGRSPAEYAGATPYGETRGGHVPGARSLHFRNLIGPDGRLLPRPQIAARLQELGVTPTTPVAIYCTGGIRSAWLTVVLTDIGYDARNYAGSMWEWSASAPDAFPLVRAEP